MYFVDSGTVIPISPTIVILAVGIVDIPAHSFMVTSKNYAAGIAGSIPAGTFPKEITHYSDEEQSIPCTSQYISTNRTTGVDDEKYR